jgi:hypothetical protein
MRRSEDDRYSVCARGHRRDLFAHYRWSLRGRGEVLTIPDQPWAFAIDPDGLIVMNLEASEEPGEHLNDIYRKCERLLLDTFTKREQRHEPVTESPDETPNFGRGTCSCPARLWRGLGPLGPREAMTPAYSPIPPPHHREHSLSYHLVRFIDISGQKPTCVHKSLGDLHERDTCCPNLELALETL